MSKINFMALPISDEVKEQIINAIGGKQIRIPKALSKFNPIYRKKRNENIYTDYKNGISIREISLKYKISRTWIWRILKGNNIEIRGERGNSSNKKELIKNCIKEGISICKISRIFGYSRPTIYKIKKEDL